VQPRASTNRIARLALLASVSLLAARAVHAQVLPSTPLTLGGGRVVVSGSLSASIGPPDDRAYYNLTGYNNDILRLVQVSFDVSVRLSSRSEIVAGVDGLTPVDHWSWNGYPTSLHLAVTPWNDVTVRAGIVEPPFGAFLRRVYGPGNLLIGYPLAYHYATTVRTDAFPASADELLRRRGLGAVTHYSIGDTYRAPGLPLVDPFGWNPGVEVDLGNNRVHGSAALLRGGIANRYHQDGGSDCGWTFSGRFEAQPTAALRLGASLAHGGYADLDTRPITDTAAYNRHPLDTSLGFDAEYSKGYWLVRGEAMLNRRTVPAFSSPYLEAPLHGAWLMVEGRYKLFPGMYLAARVEHLSFSTIAGSTTTSTWDAPVTRVEAGGGYAVTRNVMGKVTYQHNSRDSRFTPHQQLVAAEVVLWF
jgi:hypothetical protein